MLNTVFYPTDPQLLKFNILKWAIGNESVYLQGLDPEYLGQYSIILTDFKICIPAINRNLNLKFNHDTDYNTLYNTIRFLYLIDSLIKND